MAGGIFGGSMSAPSPTNTITACYNEGTITGLSYVGGIVGRFGTATACYNLGTVTGGSSIIGGDGTVTACYRGGASPVNNNATEFSATAWPGPGIHQQWDEDDGTAPGPDPKNPVGPYWKSLGGWNGGTPIYPKLYWE
jgi:hypothetical protein